MPGEYRLLNRALGEAEAAFDWLKHRRRRHRQQGCYHIQPYRGHGTAETLYISGRVFEGSPVPAARADDAYLRNLWHTTRRLGSDEVPAARVRATTSGVSRTVLADDEGFFELFLPVRTDTGEAGGEIWREIEIELLDPPPAGERIVAKGFSIVPPREARFGVISDIDDTVVKTDVANLLRMLRLVLLTNAHMRLPFPGVAAFYRALHCGPAGPFTNPLFYVSSSPWNFYDLLNEVLEVHGIPVGPLLLKDYGLARDLLLSRGHMEHKLGSIERILDTHQDLGFVLVGDSGQHDPEIYTEIVRRHPHRILAIYIRDVTREERDVEVRKLVEEVGSFGVEMLFVRDTVDAAEHAAAHGLIDAAGLEEVCGEHLRHIHRPGPIETVLRG